MTLPVCAAISAALVYPASSQGADPGTPIETIIVTGSNIRRADAETAAPVQIVTREDIQRTGKTTIADFLQTLTSNGQGSIPKTFGNGFAPGGGGVSLRGLGASSTLVLLNNRRIAPYGLADDGQKVFTDLSVIPLEAVERVEVLKDGASAIYGSDAIAGVINVILRSEYTGTSARASFATSEDGDGNTSKLSVTAGFGDLEAQGYNVYFNLEGSKSDGIRTVDRAGRKWIGTGDIRPWGYDEHARNLGGSITPGVGTSSPTGSVRNPADLNFYSLPGCEQFTTLAEGDPGGGCLWDFAQFTSLTPEQKYLNVFGHGTLRLTENLEGYAEIGYSHKETRFQITPSGVSGAWGYPGGPVNANSGPGATVLGPNHPDNPYPGTAVRLRYSAFDVGPRVGDTTNEFWRAVAGLKATVGTWDIDGAVLHSETSLRNERTGYLRYSAVRAALADPTSSLYPWRIGENADLNSDELYAAISPKIHADADSSLDSIDIKASHPLLMLPGGELGFAAGMEYRILETSLTPQTYTDVGDIIGLGYSAYDGKQEVFGTYVELLAPVHQTLELSGAVRYDHYMGGDDATTPKFGFKWHPLTWLAFRGTYAEGFRTPNPAENGDGGLAAFTTAADPVRCPNGTPAAGGSTADCARNIALIVTPNPLLKPEESESVTLGLVLSPTSSTTITIDAWRIERTNEINSETASGAIEAGKVLRDDDLLNGVPGTGTLLAAYADYINSASTRVRGIDLDVRQSFELASHGSLTLDLQWGHMDSFLRTEADGTRFEYAGTHGNCDVTNCIGTPKDRINFGATWTMQAWSVSALASYRSSFDNVAFEGDDCANQFADGSDAPRGCEIPSFYTVDLSGHWNATDSLQIFGSVENLLDRIAPLDPLTYGAVNFNPLDVSGAIGRFFTLGLSFSF